MNTTQIIYDVNKKELLIVVSNAENQITYNKLDNDKSIEDFYKLLKSACESKKMPCFSIEVNCFSEDKS